MKKFRKKPFIIEAVQFTGPGYAEVLEEIPEAEDWNGYLDDDGTWKLEVPTLEGVAIATIGDWIIKGIKGEFYPIKQDIFEESYEYLGE